MLLQLLALLPLTTFAIPSQFPFTSPAKVNLLNTQADFDILSHPHPLLKNHSVRIRTPKGLCDPEVEQKSGYLDTKNGRHFYFWQFDSRNDPKNDPIVLWLNGGPGCSSFTGLLQELGPCRIQESGEPKFNPYSWNNNASLIFLDQPIGVGYSYGEKGDKGVWTSEAASHDVYSFLQLFLGAFSEKFGNSAFHIAGESYGGRYVPLFADYIVEQNLLDNGLPKINLRSTLVGNGFTDPKLQYASYYPTVCTNITGYGPYVSEKACEKMYAAIPRCQELEQQCYDNPTNAVLCLSAATYCENTQTKPYFETGRNPYNMEKFGDYVEEQWISDYLNRDDVRHQLGIDKEEHGGVKKFVGCSNKVAFRFSASGDVGKPSFQKVAHLLENGIRGLYYVGRADFICNYLGNMAWLAALNWSGREAFNAEPLAPWYASDEDAKAGLDAGEFRTSGNLAFATVNNAGHFVPYDRPAEALHMFNSWIHGKKVSTTLEAASEPK